MSRKLRFLLFILGILVGSCTPPRVTQSMISVVVNADGKSYQVQLPAGSSVQDAYTKTGIILSALDRSDPPLYTILVEGSNVQLYRITEKFEVEQVVIPYERQVIQNDTLPLGETRLSQPGENGLKEVTSRLVYEDGVEVQRSEVKTTILEEAVPEIVMVGSQTPFSSVSIPGRLVYLSAGNAWIMEGTTGNRRAIITTGDLDGHVFNLSPDGKWLLFTRNTGEENTINTLWAAQVEEGLEQVVDLSAVNVVHFAGWAPDASTIAYTTVEPRLAPPGWQANNNLFMVNLSPSGLLINRREILETNYGGVYGWWGMIYAWALDGKRLAYAKPDGVGLIDAEEGGLTSILDILPLQTGADWAWVPGLSWGANGDVLYTVVHTAPPGAESPESSQQFDLAALPMEGGALVKLRLDVGMFAYPVCSPLQKSDTGIPGEKNYQVAYLQAENPQKSETSRYRLIVIDRDGSNEMHLFPEEGMQGLTPQQVVWSPEPLVEGDYSIALIYQGNIWLLQLPEGQTQQITGDGLTVRVDWR